MLVDLMELDNLLPPPTHPSTYTERITLLAFAVFFMITHAKYQDSVLIIVHIQYISKIFCFLVVFIPLFFYAYWEKTITIRLLIVTVKIVYT